MMAEINNQKVMKALIVGMGNGDESIIRGFEMVNPDFLILVVDKDIKEEQKKTLKEIKEFLKGIENDVRLEVKKIDTYELHENAVNIAKIIKKYSKYDFYVDITAFSKPKSMAFAFGAMNIENTKQIFVTNKEGDIMEIPLLKIDFSENEKTILRILNKYSGQKINIGQIITKSNLKQSTIYKYLSEFKNKGYIKENEDKTIQLTNTGKFVML